MTIVAAESTRDRGVDELPVMLTTLEAAKALNRRACTLRKWACMGGPIDPIRVNGRLAWPLDRIRALLTGAGEHLSEAHQP